MHRSRTRTPPSPPSPPSTRPLKLAHTRTLTHPQPTHTYTSSKMLPSMPLYTLRAWTQDGIICECKHIVLYEEFVHACMFVCTGVCNILKSSGVAHDGHFLCVWFLSLVSPLLARTRVLSLSRVVCRACFRARSHTHVYTHTRTHSLEHTRTLSHSRMYARVHFRTHHIHAECTRMNPYRERSNSWYQ